MLVVDASIIGGILIADEWTGRVPAVLTEMGDNDLVAPSHWAVEILNLLTIAMRRKRISVEDRQRMIDTVFDLGVELDAVPLWQQQRAIVGLADEAGLTVYDAAYLHLAMRLSASLATNDRPLARAAASLGVPVVSTLS